MGWLIPITTPPNTCIPSNPPKKPRDERESPHTSLVQANKTKRKAYPPTHVLSLNLGIVWPWSHLGAVNQRVKRIVRILEARRPKLAPLAPCGSRVYPSLGTKEMIPNCGFLLEERRLLHSLDQLFSGLLPLQRVAHLPLTRQWSTL